MDETSPAPALRGKLVRLFFWVVLVFAAGGACGVGFYRYLDSRTKDGDPALSLTRAEGDGIGSAPASEGSTGTDGNPTLAPAEGTPPGEASPAPPAAEAPPPSPENPPPKKDEPTPPKHDSPPVRPRKEPPQIDDALKPLLVALKSKKATERLQALEDIAKRGESGRAAARGVCEVLTGDPIPAVRQCALTTLEKIYPELHKHVVVLAVEIDLGKQERAVREIGLLGEDGRPAVPVVASHLHTAVATMTNQRIAPSRVGDLVVEDLRALSLIAPDEPLVQKTILELTRAVGGTTRLVDLDSLARVRPAAVRIVGEMVRNNPDQAKPVVSGLIAAACSMGPGEPRTLAVGILGTLADDHPELRWTLANGLLVLLKSGEVAAITPLGKCGREAKDALPALRQLKLHPVEGVRLAAGDAVAKIEEALGSSPKSPKK